MVLECARTHGDVGNEVERHHIGGRHQDQFGTGQGQAPGVFRELQVVANQQAQLPSVQLHHGEIIRPGAEHRVIEIAKQVGLAVVAQALALGVDQLYGVVDLAILGPFRVTVQNRQPGTLRQFGNRLCRRPILSLGQRANGFGANVIAAEEHLRQHQHIGAARFMGHLVQALQVSGHLQRQRRALVQGDTHVQLLIRRGRLARFHRTHRPGPGSLGGCCHRNGS